METVVASARADTEQDGSLLVRWELHGGPAEVDLAVGRTPDRLDHRHQITVPAGRTSWRVQHPGSARVFVSVAAQGSGPAVVTTDRRIAFRGVQNFRDLGGYRTGLDGSVRWGMIFRADALHGLLHDDMSLYEELGLRAVYDLRGDEERTARPNRVESRHLSVLSRAAGAESAPPAPGGSATDGERILAGTYKGLIDHAAVQIGVLFTDLSRDGGLPAVFHCHAGKDRTGVVAAVLLAALGVDRHDILDDYELTARYRLRSHQEPTYERLLRYGFSPEAAAGVLGAPRWAMQEALDHLDHRYGGADHYLTGPAGIRKEDLQALRSKLIDRSF